MYDKTRIIGDVSFSDISRYLRICGVDDSMYSYLKDTFMFDSLPMNVKFVRCKHTPTMVGHNVSICYNGTKILYSGDCATYKFGTGFYFSENQNDFKEFDYESAFNNYDLIYTECCCSYGSDPVHFPVEKLNTYFSDFKDKVYCMHFDSYYCIVKCENLGYNVVKVEDYVF